MISKSQVSLSGTPLAFAVGQQTIDGTLIERPRRYADDMMRGEGERERERESREKEDCADQE